MDGLCDRRHVPPCVGVRFLHFLQQLATGISSQCLVPGEVWRQVYEKPEGSHTLRLVAKKEEGGGHTLRVVAVGVVELYLLFETLIVLSRST